MVTLLDGEKIILRQDNTELLGIGKGRIYLTDKRFIFDLVSGFIFKKVKTVLIIDLSDITKIETKENNIIIETSADKHIISSKDSINLANLIKNEIKSRIVETATEVRVVSPPSPLTDFCPFCGAKLASNTIYCGTCGKRVK